MMINSPVVRRKTGSPFSPVRLPNRSGSAVAGQIKTGVAE